MTSGDLYKAVHSALLLSAVFINDFQVEPLPHSASWGILRCPCPWLLWGTLWALSSWRTTYLSPRGSGSSAEQPALGPYQQPGEMALETGPPAPH